MSVITLTTDYGTNDWFVGTLRGVMASINSAATVVDITHEIAAGDVRAGAFALMAAYRFFPYHSIHVVVVDPGVGGDRAALVIQTPEHYFVAPDNGVLSWALRQEKIQAIHRLENESSFSSRSVKPFTGGIFLRPWRRILAGESFWIGSVRSKTGLCGYRGRT
jgi:S-adenosylmethionine hydrolase